MPNESDAIGGFGNIRRFVVLMLENRSFDHLLGFLKGANPKVAGLSGAEFNQKNPNAPADPKINVTRAASFMMTFDPAHEFYDVQMQLYGVRPSDDPTLPPIANPPTATASMNGFVASAALAADYGGDENLVMGCFQADQLPVLSTLASEFALFNFWYSSLPGPTWPNRFFVHAATSGGLTDSPTTAQIVGGFDFENGTIYERLDKAGKSWCLYHDGLPQTAGISALRGEFISPVTEKFQDMEDFFEGVKKGELSDYNFIEPKYDTGNNYVDGNSMHPLNDLRKGEQLVKDVYEALRNSRYWQDTMLIITFDEHGGFFDHQSPPKATPTGDDTTYAKKANGFSFDRLGVRVPGIVVSAYTQRGTIIGDDPANASTVFDHTSVLATVEKCFGLAPLTKRDAAANTLDVAINQATARASAGEAPTSLPAVALDSLVAGPVSATGLFAAAAQAPLSSNQKTMAALALAVELEITKPEYHAALISNHQKLVEQGDAGNYIQTVEEKVLARRDNPPKA